MRHRFVQKQVGVRLKALRKEKTGLSQEKFAYSIGVDRAYYAHIEQGRHGVSIVMLKKIADGMGIGLEEMFKGM